MKKSTTMATKEISRAAGAEAVALQPDPYQLHATRAARSLAAALAAPADAKTHLFQAQAELAQAIGATYGVGPASGAELAPVLAQLEHGILLTRLFTVGDPPAAREHLQVTLRTALRRASGGLA